MQKIYCYVDESGQETGGKVFVVSVVVIMDNRDELLHLCESIEKATGKGIRKWRRTNHERRMAYLREVFRDDRFTGTLRYSVFRGNRDYDLSTVVAITKAVRWRAPDDPFRTMIYIDGLPKNKRAWYANQLLGLGLQNKQVRGVRKDESNALIRLADAVAGLLRDSLANEYDEAVSLVKSAKRRGILVEV